MDYSELVKDLRYCSSGYETCEDCKRIDTIACEPVLMSEAADAIEELQRELQLAEFDADNWRDAYHHWFENYQNDVPKWIPVTERLPQDDGIYIICDHYGNVMSRHFCKSHGKFAGYWHFNGSAKYGNPTHWMPLPEPPRTDPCADCVHYPPSSTDGKPCCACDPANPLTNCHEAKEET